MFGDMMGMINKIKETQAKVEETKKRLDKVTLQEKSNDELLKVKITANREVKSIEIDDKLLEDKEQLEDYLILTLNKAIKKAGDVNEAEISAVAKDGLPDIPGLTS
ncbi:YbaB/EbfC family nucleoid-associated protein [Psychroflexus montanilacus]|uniref:YbaB/EbfC family nucleoid-associated protein n=1 Tax=Psychroflexus montanilacus TaxID=2873598 RepID=UPI001CCE8CBC|nr:YbaB/EbfC family nucleoid-associated protein [Psychroflexus montanilacus]MBZ9650693.1 YbaB/EbfC family nucleoid-associated protein [Psychroflexus montanilacus]